MNLAKELTTTLDWPTPAWPNGDDEVLAAEAFDASKHPMDRFTVGDAQYRLNSPMAATFLRNRREFLLPALEPGIVGHGETLDAARRDWRERFHARFQTLLAKRPWEMTPAELAEWRRMEDVIDVPAHRRETPYVANQIGVVVAVHPRTVRWIDDAEESIPLDLAPPDFARYEVGQRFQATVLRDSQTDELRQLLQVSRRDPLPTPEETAARLAELLAAAPSSRDLPAVDWKSYD